MAPSRDALSASIGKILFLRLSKEDVQKLLTGAGEKPDWAAIKNFTRQTIKQPDAAATLSTMFVTELAVLNATLEPQMFLAGLTTCRTRSIGWARRRSSGATRR